MTGLTEAVVEGAASKVTGERVWRAITKQSFAVLSYVTPTGQPRSSGVVYAAGPRQLYVAVAPDSWKAVHIPATDQVAVTVLVRRGGLLSLVFPIPPATISFHARAVVHQAGAPTIDALSTQLAGLVPAERLSSCRIIEIFPEDHFLTYGIGVPLRRMRDPRASRARVPVP
ncbi:pyridoxamine 5'-phosphate oxidase family protein [Kribbella sp. NPDC051137]|uniref:pyridoxamine 5'-phosphate oxidase family protein n=1 Tax=Kribbella sp. NPDC051137 TaxID=3155045 RepID=UPI002F8AE262